MPFPLTVPNSQRSVGRLAALRVLRISAIVLALSCHVSELFSQSARDETTATIFQKQIRPLFDEYCLSCHDSDEMNSGINLELLTGEFADQRLFLWKDILKQVSMGAMPPEEEKQPTEGQRGQLMRAIEQCMNLSQARNAQVNGLVRRLTVSQYRNTLESLLGIQDELTSVLPADGISRDGFSNNAQVLGFSPLQMEYYFEIAEKALDICIVDESEKPTIQNFRVDFGQAINANPCPDELILGANSHLLRNEDFVVSELSPAKPFDFTPFEMRKSFDFIEGYEGNGTVRGWRKFDSIYHSVFACMRGSTGYPLGEPYAVVPEGLLLRPAIPSSEVWMDMSTYGPQANFKISLRELPEQGNFRLRVIAGRYPDGLLLAASEPVSPATEELESHTLAWASAGGNRIDCRIENSGIYQVELNYSSHSRQAESRPESKRPKDPDGTRRVELKLGGRVFAQNFPVDHSHDSVTRPFLILRLPSGEIPIELDAGERIAVEGLIIRQLATDSQQALRFEEFEATEPLLGIHVGLRRDCGSTLKQVGKARRVGDEVREFWFEDAINNYPRPHTEKDNVNYLAGLREIGVRSEYTDGRPTPRLLIQSVEFEGPYYETWPPATHRRIFFDSAQRSDPDEYAKEILQRFMERAYRRPVTPVEQDLIYGVWRDSFDAGEAFHESIRDALLVVLTSPQFLLLSEESQTPEPEDLSEYELASKLSYFLWNGPPDQRLLERAADDRLHGHLSEEVDRMLRDERFQRFVHRFTSEWLGLQQFDLVEIDSRLYPRLTRDTRTQLREEPTEFLAYLFAKNLPLRNIIDADFVVANETVASYYELAARVSSRFDFVAVPHGQRTLGGVLSMAGILAGLSDGRESNPVKRGAWFARKMIADPPDDPPPNVPQLQESGTEELTLRERLELHRDQPGCVQCHSGIDPWGLPFEQYDAGGRFRPASMEAAQSILPDGTTIHDLANLKQYLLDKQMDRVAFSFLKHLASYATGRNLTYNEVEWLEGETLKLRDSDYRMQDMIHFVVSSNLFLKK